MDDKQRKATNSIIMERLWDTRAMAKRVGSFYGALEDKLDKENKEEIEV